MGLEQRLTAWAEEGLISHDQAAAIRLRERTLAPSRETLSMDPPAQRRGSLVAEAVGYMGAALTLVAAGLVLGDFWDQVTEWGRLLLVVVLTVVVFAAGWALRDRPQPAIRRLTSVLWFATSIGVALVVGLAGDPTAVEDRQLSIAVAVVVAAVSWALYRLRPAALQLLALSLGVGGVAMTVLAYPDAEVDPAAFGLVLWALGVAWVLLAEGGWLAPATAARVIGVLAIGVGCQTAVFGAYPEPAILLALTSAAVLLWVAVVGGSTVMLSFAVAGVFVFVPQAVFQFFGDSIGAPLALLLTGLLLVGASVGLVVLRREITIDGVPTGEASS